MGFSLERYLTALVGKAPDGRPIEAAAPCASGMGRRYAVPVGKVPGGTPILAYGECRGLLAANRRYAVTFVGWAPDGKPIYQVPCITCCTAVVSVFYQGLGPVIGARVQIGDQVGFTADSGQVGLPVAAAGTYRVIVTVASKVYFDELVELDCGDPLLIEIPARPTRCCPSVPLSLPLYYFSGAVGAEWEFKATLTWGYYEVIPGLAWAWCWGGYWEQNPGETASAFMAEQATGQCFSFRSFTGTSTATGRCEDFRVGFAAGFGRSWIVGPLT